MKDTDGFLQLFPISSQINELQHKHTQHMHFWEPAVQHHNEEYHRPLLKEIVLLGWFVS